MKAFKNKAIGEFPLLFNRKAHYVLILAGIISLILGLFFVGDQSAWSAFLVNNLFFSLTALAAIVFFTIHVLAGAVWIKDISLMLKTIAAYLPAGAIGFIILFFFLDNIYSWAETGLNENLNWFKIWYLNKTHFIIRNLVCFAGWILLGFASLRHPGKRKWNAGLFMVFFTLSSSPFIWDWIISSDINWFSTLFAFYVIIGAMISSIAVLIMLSIALKQKGIVTVKRNTITNLGIYLFTFSCIWIYMWYSQFMLIWYGNLPEEANYFILRIREYPVLFYGNAILNFAIPFFTLVSLRAKSNPLFLIIASVSCLAGQWLDKYLLVVPGLQNGGDQGSWIFFGTGLGFLGLFLMFIHHNLKSNGV